LSGERERERDYKKGKGRKGSSKGEEGNELKEWTFASLLKYVYYNIYQNKIK
jgi:hypothetical protein